MNSAKFDQQVLYYKKIRFPRAVALQRIRDDVNRNGTWNKKRLERFNELWKLGALPKPEKVKEEAMNDAVKPFVAKFKLKKKTKTWSDTKTFKDINKLKREESKLKNSLERSGFKKKAVSGDVGMWTVGYAHARHKKPQLFADVTAIERRKPYKLLLELYFVSKYEL